MATYPVSSEQIMRRAKKLHVGFLCPRPAVSFLEQATSSTALSLFHSSIVPVDHQVSIVSKVSLLMSVKKTSSFEWEKWWTSYLYEDNKGQHTLLQQRTHIPNLSLQSTDKAPRHCSSLKSLGFAFRVVTGRCRCFSFIQPVHLVSWGMWQQVHQPGLLHWVLSNQCITSDSAWSLSISWIYLLLPY